MRKLRLVGQSDALLRRKCRPIKGITDARKAKIGQMFKLMDASNGIVLAAPQVGWNARVFVMNITGTAKDELVFINPVIMEESGGKVEMVEGCLSFPGLIGPVERNFKAIVQAQDIDGNLFTLEGESLIARCMLHEIDHLHGVLFIDKAKNTYRIEDK